ncbi:MAG TPA: hypothetical protein VK404_07250 [Spirosoma sp.]|nr:hypothetical protein [Spirosoma sp.]
MRYADQATYRPVLPVDKPPMRFVSDLHQQPTVYSRPVGFEGKARNTAVFVLRGGVGQAPAKLGRSNQ